jgi:hypothetical protein
MAEEQQGRAGGLKKKHFAGLAYIALLFLGLWLWSRSADRPAAAKPEAGSSGQQIAAAPAPKAPVQLQPVKGRPDAGVWVASSQKSDAGDAQLAGHLISMGQSLALGEALAKNAANADKYVDKLCSETAKLKQHPAMPDNAGTKADAAAFMAPRMDYEKPLDQPPGSLHLPDELRAKLRGADWLSKITDEDLAGRDFAWMAALAQFDHWSYLGAGRLRDLPDPDALHGSIPNYSSLMGWSRLRYALALRQGDSAAASAEVRHLADLIATQGLLISQMVAVAIYRLDSSADLEGLQKTRDLSFASMYFAYPGVDPETVRKAMGCSLSPCVALAEAAAMNKSFASAAASDNLSLVNQLAAEKGCEPALFTRINGTHEMITSEALNVLGDDLPLDIPRRLDGL